MRDPMRTPGRNPRLQSPGPTLVALLLVVAAALYLWFSSQRSGPLSGQGTGRFEGHARIIDGDSLVVGGREIRFKGIDAPEGRQQCTRNGTPWACGEEARRHLAIAIGGRPVVCNGGEADQHGRLLAVCEADGRSLNAAMVEEGYAMAYGNYGAEEQRARAAKRGLWSGEFERPRDWRAKHPR